MRARWTATVPTWLATLKFRRHPRRTLGVGAKRRAGTALLGLAIGLAAAGCGAARALSNETTHGALDAVAERDPELVRRIHEDLRADPTVRGLARRATGGVIDALEAALPSRDAIARALADVPRRWVEGLDVEAALGRLDAALGRLEERARRLGREGLAAVDEAVRRGVAAVDLRDAERLGLDVAGRVGGELGRQLGAELSREVLAQLAAAVSGTASTALLAQVTATARELAAAATRGVWDETRRQIEEQQRELRGSDGQRIAGAVGVVAALIALVLTVRWIRSLQARILELEKAR